MPAALRFSAGQSFGDLSVIGTDGQDSHGSWMWKCSCRCGGETRVRGSHLKSGKTRSCGCGVIAGLARARTSHGMARTPLYRRWQAMRQRCENPRNSEYRNYGGRGIAVDPKWASFDVFFVDMADGFSPDLEIERVDGEKGYCKENCIWATRQNQQRNKRTNHRITWGDETLTIVEWGERLKVKPNTILTRIRRGWSVGRALGFNG